MQPPRLRPHLPVLRRHNSTVASFRKSQKACFKHSPKLPRASFPPNWSVTCGLEVHAQLNTTNKLFSDAPTSSVISEPNSHLSVIDAALPGVQPTLNPQVLLRALHASLVFSCQPQPVSRFDRKHYFYWDQPAGYQLTQFYHPLAVSGRLRLAREDGGQEVTIKQVQIEQDTGKTVSAPPYSLIDLNRVGIPLVEIITEPFGIESAETAGKVLSRIQAMLRAVDACIVGMEWGGLRADVNISVCRPGEQLGVRCEIKNLSSFKAVEDAVAAEAVRQIQVLEDGGIVQGETRRWDAEAKITRRLRGKEGVVDYRFMPEPDLPPIRLTRETVEKVRAMMPKLPDEFVQNLVERYGLTAKDANTLLAWDDGRTGLKDGVVAYFKSAVRAAQELLPEMERRVVGKSCGNWVVHELGGQLAARSLDWPENKLDSERLGELVGILMAGKITSPTAKGLLPRIFDGGETASAIIAREGLEVRGVSPEEVEKAIHDALSTDRGRDVFAQLQSLKSSTSPADQKKIRGLRGFLLGQVLRTFSNRADPAVVEKYLDSFLSKL